eukprot:TRINITY_DN93475_c0_g1_i1.p1 TRINITY_DN93475_c0_g1~~TRINITY_DN93475_c0_g1_i1.p1  ORF type:complete len:778 (+),score=230.29 TRINITY_DN93475_c0_g1_i1:43-2334(+)
MPPKAAAKPPSKAAAIKALIAKQQAELKAREEDFDRQEQEALEARQKKEEEAKQKLAEEKKKAEEEKKKQEAEKAKEEDGGKKKPKPKIPPKNQAAILARLAATGGTVAGLKVDKDLQAKIDQQREAAEKLREQKEKEAEERSRIEQEQQQRDEKLREQQKAEIRAPICCVLGHVDTGKTKLLDKIRRTNVQTGEAGGITQQIGASFFPIDAILRKTACINSDMKLQYQIPGLLIIDTPGHESFTNLRSRGSGLCDIAIVVIDIMHGLEQQTLESLQLLRQRKTPFLVALNKVDRIYDWEPMPDAGFCQSLEKQKQHSQLEFETRAIQVIDQLTAQGFNTKLYWKNKDFKKWVSVVPTSAHTGEGIPDLLLLMTQLTQNFLKERITRSDKLQCTVLEVKMIEGLGYTIDVILVNGELHEGDVIVVGGMQGPIVTTIRALLTPQPLKEMRVKGEYIHQKTVHAAMGVKICAQDLEHAVAGSQLLVAHDGITSEELDTLKEEVDVEKLLSAIEKETVGVTVQASTLGSLEALLAFLKDCKPKIPVANIGIGPIHKRDLVRTRAMLDTNTPEYALILAFDVPTSREIREMADREGIRIFEADIIYHLCDQFTKYMEEIRSRKKEEQHQVAVFPVEMKIVPGCVFHNKDPIVVGVEVMDGFLRPGTPLCCEVTNEDGKQEIFSIGRVAGIERDHRAIPELRPGQQAAVKINAKEPTTMVGRQFNETHILVSQLSRDSIDALKAGFRDEMTTDDWKLVIKLKKQQEIL